MRERYAPAAAIGLALGILCSAVIVGTHHDPVEPEYKVADAVVYEVNAEYDTVTFVDKSGELWVAEMDSVAGFEVGADHTLVFDDMGTQDIYDDELVGII